MRLSNRQDTFFLLAALAALWHLFNATASGERLFGNAFFCAAFATVAKEKKDGTPAAAERKL